MFAVPHSNPGHDCSLHHLEFPARGSLEIPLPRSYDSRQLLEPIPNYRFRRPVPILPPTEAAQVRYQFLNDYTLLDDKTATLEEWTSWVETAFVQLDQYFFKGALSQDNSIIMRLSVLDRHKHGLWAFYLSSDSGLWGSGLITIYLRSSTTGERVDKLVILQSLTHEMCHAYLDLFYHYCPKDDWYKIWANDGHGPLWRETSTRVFKHIEGWHPSLANLTNSLSNQLALGSFYHDYHPWLENNVAYYHRIWERWPTQAVSKGSRVFPKGSILRPDRVIDFARSLIKLRFNDYSAFLKNKAPLPVTAYKVYSAYRKLMALLTQGYIIIAIFMAGVFSGKVCFALFMFLKYFWEFWSEASVKQAHANDIPSIMRLAGRPPFME